MRHTRTSLVLAALFLVLPNVSFASSQFYGAPGTYYFTVPSGVTSMSASVIGAGGGGGGSDGYGDNHAGGGGGSGGYWSGSFAVSAGQVITVTVGAGGAPADWTFNGNYICLPGGTTSNKNGASGGNTTISDSAGTIMVTGGQGAGGNTSDNCDGYSGAGGTPGGVAGGPINCNRNDYCPTSGGANGSGYGNGGSSNGFVGCNGRNNAICPAGGTSGSVTLYWTPPVDNASCSGLSAPSSVAAGSSFPASVTMTNTGGSTWTAATNYRLGSQSPQDNTTWGTSRVYLPYSVSPGGSVTFSGNLSAPTTPGTYTFAWKMLQETVQWFGATCSQTITVTPPSCTASGTLAWPNTASGPCSVTSSWTVPPGQSMTTYNTASGYSGSETWSCSSAGTWVGPTNVSCTASAPTVALSMSPTSVAYGGYTNLSYTSTNASYCNEYVNGGLVWSNAPTSFNWGTVGPYYSNQTWTIMCYNSAGASGQDSKTLTVAPPPAACSATTIGSCNLSSTSSGGSSGSCSSGYTGSCSYYCSNGTWSQSSNSCTVVNNYFTAAPTCTVSAGSSYCSNSTASWNISNPTNPLLYISTFGTSFSVNSSASNIYVRVDYPQTTLVLYNGASAIGSQTVSAVCASGTSWNGSSCAVPSCTTPWGSTVASGVSVTAFQSPSVTAPTTCASDPSESRTCNSGTLSGSYQYQNCSVLNPTATISVTPTRVKSGGTATVTWSSTDTTSCSVTGPGFSASGTSGSQAATVTSQSTYTVSCNSGAATATAKVNVVPTFQEF